MDRQVDRGSGNPLTRRDFLRFGLAGSAAVAGAAALGVSGLMLVNPDRTLAAARSFTLTVRAGTITTVDGKSLYAWGYTDDAAVFKLPGPVLTVTEGDSVSVTLQNNRSEEHNFFIQGVTPTVRVAPGASYTYTFTAPPAGTYLYFDSLSPVHRALGLYGALISLPADGSQTAWVGGPTYDQQYLWLYSTLDERWNTAVQNGQAVNTSDFRPNYSLLNGKSFPDLEQTTGAITDAVVMSSVGKSVLIRQVNASLVPHAPHYHGFHFQQLTRNGQRLAAFPLKDTVAIAPGESVDVRITFDQAGHYPMHDHNLIAAVANGVYPKGIMGMLHIM